MISQRIRIWYYKTLGTNVINNPMSPSSVWSYSGGFNTMHCYLNVGDTHLIFNDSLSTRQAGIFYLKNKYIGLQPYSSLKLIFSGLNLIYEGRYFLKSRQQFLLILTAWNYKQYFLNLSWRGDKNIHNKIKVYGN